MIHSTAIIEPGAEIATDVEIGAYSVIGPNVRIDSGTTVGPHAVIRGHTTIGKNNRIFQFVSLGEIPQDKKYAGEPTSLEIGDNNVIREFCTFNIGTAQDVGVTRIGNDNWIMAYVHIAHDCQIGNHTIFANNAQLAGHVTVEDYAILGGFTIVHQFCSIGEHSMSGMGSVLTQDLPPYVTISGHPAQPHGVNSEGLKRRGFSKEAILEIRRAYKTLYKSGMSLQDAKEEIAGRARNYPELVPFLEFLSRSNRGIVR